MVFAVASSGNVVIVSKIPDGAQNTFSYMVGANSDPMAFSPPGSLVHGIFQARVLEWGAIASPRGSPNLTKST